MTAAEALQEIRELAQLRMIMWDNSKGSHAVLRMDERNVSRRDVICALENVHTAKLQKNGRWRVVGPDLDGVDLAVILILDDVPAIVVTVF